jgi:hypothetical protein
MNPEILKVLILLGLVSVAAITSLIAILYDNGGGPGGGFED